MKKAFRDGFSNKKYELILFTPNGAVQAYLLCEIHRFSGEIKSVVVDRSKNPPKGLGTLMTEKLLRVLVHRDIHHSFAEIMHCNIASFKAIGYGQRRAEWAAGYVWGGMYRAVNLFHTPPTVGMLNAAGVRVPTDGAVQYLYAIQKKGHVRGAPKTCDCGACAV
jgi:hypothetical protein